MTQQPLLMIVAAIVVTAAAVPPTYTSIQQQLHEIALATQAPTTMAPVLVPLPTPAPTPTLTQTPEPRPTPTPTPSPTHSPPPTLYFQASVGGGGYGVILAGDPVLISASINTNRQSQPFPLASGDLLSNLQLSVRDERSQTVRPVLQRPIMATPKLDSQIGVVFDATPISAWGYDLRKPGEYRVSFVFNAVTTNWAVTHGFRFDNELFGDVRIVRTYADVDRHFFPPPKGWRRDRPDACVPHQADGHTHFPSLAAGNATPSGNECFLVYLLEDSIANGIRRERELATQAETTLLAEEDDVACGHEHAATFSYQRKTSPFTHTEAVVLKMSAGYIVARYERPAAAGDDVAAEDALDAPCALL